MQKKKAAKAKPFLKWAGGKANLISTLEERLPAQIDQLHDLVYVEPFIGGAAMLFHMLQTHANIKRVVINDINPDLINTYQIVKDNIEELIVRLREIETSYMTTTFDERTGVYMAYREEYNTDRQLKSPVERAALFIFLNHTCFNGLYRVNSKDMFNVPHGRYKKPAICNEETLRNCHKILNTKEITFLCGDYNACWDEIVEEENVFFYLDPPYRPLLNESNFKEYTNSPFSDQQQEELCDFCRMLDSKGILWMQSNSDSRNEDGSSYFEELYTGFEYENVYAPRYINAFGGGRGKMSESLMRNYKLDERHADE